MDLVDELLDNTTSRRSFLLDGQTVVLEDYLDVRPERASELSGAMRDGRIEAGPWFVLPDELIPGGEALVRNLLAGRRTLRSLRAQAPPVLYCPDSFGHPAVLPEIAQEFGCPVIILWRGFGGARGPQSNVFWWTAPSGERALVYHLSKSGYELGANLPAGDAAGSRWRDMREQLTARRALDVALLLNGADHHARQPDLDRALESLEHVAAPDVVRHGTLAAFAESLAQDATGRELPDVQGELRDSYGYTWTLQGTLASRAPQKRRYAKAERELLRDAEPWAALAAFQSGKSRRHLMNAAWRPLLLVQPHDTLCGCSIDRVARAAEDRIESSTIQAQGLREDALLDWLGHDRDDARRRRDEWTPALIVRNRAARVRSGVAIVDLVMRLRDVPVGPPPTSPQTFSEPVMMRVPRPGVPGPVQVIRSALHNSRVEAPRAYPHNDEVVRASAVVWVNDVPAYGLAAYPLLEQGAAVSAPVPPVVVTESTLHNGEIRLSLSGASVTLEQGGRRIDDWIAWNSRVDDGDLYTPAIRGAKFVPELTGTRVLHAGPLRGVVEQRWMMAQRDERVSLKLRFVLDAGAKFIRVHVAGTNDATSHRLRIGFRADTADAETVADAAFGPVRRRLPKVRPDLAEMEAPVPTAPLHRYVSLFDEQRGATLFSDGLTEYESGPSSIAVTLLRCVGQLSRRDLPERPGHAGWPAATPEAQCRGPFAAQLAFMLHGPREAAVTTDIDRTADDVLFPLTGDTLRSALAVPAPLHGAALDGEGLSLSAVKESEDGQWLVLRCVNLLPQLTAGTWRLGRAVREAVTARLDETPLTPVRTNGDTITFVAPPRGIVTILAR